MSIIRSEDGASPVGDVRLAELVAALSLGIDLGFGQPMEHVLRQCLIAVRLAERSGLDEPSRVAVYYTALLIGVGCHADAHEQAKWFGDDIAVRAIKYEHGLGVRSALASLGHLGAGHSPLHRFRVGLEFVLSGHREVDGMIAAHAAMARTLAGHLGLPALVLDSLGSGYELWNGRGWPGHKSGASIPIAARIALVAEFAEVTHRIGGIAAVKSLARKQRGKQFDPALATLLEDHAAIILRDLDTVQAWGAVIAAEPGLEDCLTVAQCDAALLAIANFVDLKTPHALGHARAVADLSRAAGLALHMPTTDVDTLWRTGLVLGFGRLGVSNAIWDKPGPLGPGEWERVRMTPYFTERMLHASPTLGRLGAIALHHRERMDGSGYPGKLSGGAISVPARIVGAADAYQAMREPRPHRAARTADEAASALRAEVRAGRLDGPAVEAILVCAGHRVRRRPEALAGLTAREVEVLRLLARGLSTKQIALQLAITPKTAGNHVEHIYSKISATNRAMASLFAMQHGLLPEEVTPAP